MIFLLAFGKSEHCPHEEQSLFPFGNVFDMQYMIAFLIWSNLCWSDADRWADIIEQQVLHTLCLIKTNVLSGPGASWDLRSGECVGSFVPSEVKS